MQKKLRQTMTRLSFPLLALLVSAALQILQCCAESLGKGYRRLEVPLNSSVQLQCSDSNKSADIIQNDAEVSEHWFCHLGANRNLRLRLHISSENDAGDYSCESNSTQLFTFHISVSNASSNALTKNNSDEIAAISDVTASCVEDEQPGLVVAWKKDNDVVCTVKTQCKLLNAINQINISSGTGFSRYLPPLCTVFIAVLLMTLIAIGTICMRRRSAELTNLCELHNELMNQSKPKTDFANPSRLLHERVDQLPFDASYEIRLYRLTIRKVVSSGEYGRVYAGDLRGKGLNKQTMEVAVKGPKRAAKYADVKALADELKLMMAVGEHPNVLCLIGVITENLKRGGDLYGIAEYTFGDLKTFLKKRKDYFIDELDDKSTSGSLSLGRKFHSSKRQKIQKTLGPSVTTSVLCSFIYQVANGMEFLTKKMCVHRDLAARNVLLRKNRVVRIADFGQDRQWDMQYLLKSIQYASPFKAMARESISGESRFTEKSDVWSYGILLWEIFSLGEDPFKDFETKDKLITFYEQGERLATPKYMPNKIASLMEDCWQEDPNARPTFTACKKLTENYLNESNPKLMIWLQGQLKDELHAMRKYTDWRDGPSVGVLRSENGVDLNP